MTVKRLLVASLAMAVWCTGPMAGQDGGAQPVATIDDAWEVDILFNYYDQDGENSPVTGGIGTEEMDVVSPVFIVRWNKSEDWKFQAQLGVDSITSASTDNIDLGETVVSSASGVDARAYSTLTATRTFGDQDVGFTIGFSNEYDYQSIQAGVDWSRSFRQQNTTVSAAVRHYQDTVEQYGIDGIVRGEEDRTTTDVSLGFSQVLGARTIASAELYVSTQNGFLSTPFHEVLLADGNRIAERLPDERMRSALGLRLNHAFSPRVVSRFYYRFYDDDWGIQASTVEIEPHFKISNSRDLWLYPIFRYHTQESSDYFGLPNSFVGSEEFLTADRELSEFTSEKFGLGVRADFKPNRSGWTRRISWWESRVATYSRDDGLDALTVSFGVGLSF